jgi:hypothetical protein
VLKLAGIEPQGFVAPAYAYTPALREMLDSRFRWWAGSWGLHATGAAASRGTGPAIGLASGTVTRRAVSAGVLRAATLLAGETLRLDVHPADLALPGHMLTLDWVLRHSAKRRRAVTYDELAAAGPV